MTEDTTSNPLKGMQRLSGNVHLLEHIDKPQDTSLDQSSEAAAPPNTILLFSWMGAFPRHIAKYVAGYTVLFPMSRIILVTSEQADFIYRSEATQREGLKPALEALRADPEGRVLLHLFSNGGAWQANLFAALYRDATAEALPVQAMVIDSAPGRAAFRRTVTAFSSWLPKQVVLRLVAKLVVYLVVAFVWVLGICLRSSPPTDRIRKGLNDPRLIDMRASRCYIYSETDSLVCWKDVEDNSMDAESKGMAVRREKFQGSAHVGHLRVDERRYWSAVRQTWEGRRFS